MKTRVIAEIGINHNGDMEICKKLIDIAAESGCDAVKFQKRTVEDVYSPEELEAYRESPWGKTNGEQKNGLEFEKTEYDEINSYCKSKHIDWFASAWDVKSQNFLKQYNLKYNKVASAMLIVPEMIKSVAKEGRYTFISTGMHTMQEIEYAVNLFRQHRCPFEIMHCVSTYPCANEDCNLNTIKTLREKFNCDVGYSGHEKGLQVSLAAVALGATSIERHITLNRTMYGSDQCASLEPEGIRRLVRDIRVVESAMGNGIKTVTEKEREIREKLAQPHWRKGS